jgi:uncharacterized protein YjgD (DUF1641 family)
MAKPIALELPQRDPRQELIARLQAAPAEHAEALLASYELLQELHDRRVLEVLRGALGAGDKLIESAVSAAEAKESVVALRNAIILGKMLGSINPDLLRCVAVAVEQTLGGDQKPVVEAPGLFELLMQFRLKELRRSMSLINRFLDVLGKEIKQNAEASKSK